MSRYKLHELPKAIFYDKWGGEWSPRWRGYYIYGYHSAMIKIINPYVYWCRMKDYFWRRDLKKSYK